MEWLSDDLVAWLRAQLDEDERVAREATPGPWSYDGNPSATVVAGKGGAGASLVACRSFNWPTDTASATHIALHDPPRVLAEVDAKRRILDLHTPQRIGNKYIDPVTRVPDMRCSVCHESEDVDYDNPPYPDEFPCPTVCLLALPYADRPGYRQEWVP